MKRLLLIQNRRLPLPLATVNHARCLLRGLANEMEMWDAMTINWPRPERRRHPCDHTPIVIEQRFDDPDLSWTSLLLLSLYIQRDKMMRWSQTVSDGDIIAIWLVHCDRNNYMFRRVCVLNVSSSNHPATTVKLMLWWETDFPVWFWVWRLFVSA